jgi:hypothetical protein
MSATKAPQRSAFHSSSHLPGPRLRRDYDSRHGVLRSAFYFEIYHMLVYLLPACAHC